MHSNRAIYARKCSFSSVEDTLIPPLAIGGFLPVGGALDWLGRGTIGAGGRQFEPPIEWKGYVHRAPSIVSPSLRCV